MAIHEKKKTDDHEFQVLAILYRGTVPLWRPNRYRKILNLRLGFYQMTIANPKTKGWQIGRGQIESNWSIDARDLITLTCGPNGPG